MLIRNKDRISVGIPSTPSDIRKAGTARTQSVDKPCGKVKSPCATQLVIKDGDVYLQFCPKEKARGPAIKVDTPKQAREIAVKYCQCVVSKTSRRKECLTAATTRLGRAVSTKWRKIKKRKRK